jgi:hypothetical protein
VLVRVVDMLDPGVINLLKDILLVRSSGFHLKVNTIAIVSVHLFKILERSGDE